MRNDEFSILLIVDHFIYIKDHYQGFWVFLNDCLNFVGNKKILAIRPIWAQLEYWPSWIKIMFTICEISAMERKRWNVHKSRIDSLTISNNNNIFTSCWKYSDFTKKHKRMSDLLYFIKDPLTWWKKLSCLLIKIIHRFFSNITIFQVSSQGGFYNRI